VDVLGQLQHHPRALREFGNRPLPPRSQPTRQPHENGFSGPAFVRGRRPSLRHAGNEAQIGPTFPPVAENPVPSPAHWAPAHRRRPHDGGFPRLSVLIRPFRG
jgi:hypothetical protein